MTTTEKIKNALLILVIGIVMLFLGAYFQKCQRDKNGLAITKEVDAYHTDTVKKETIKGINVESIHQALLETQDQLKVLISHNDSLTKLIKSFRSVNSVTTYSTVTTLKDSIRFSNDSIPCDFKPFIISKSKPGLWAGKFKISRGDLIIDTLSIPNTLSIIEGERKVGLFKSEQQFMATNSNTLINSTGIQSLTVKTKKKWWEHPLIWMGAGAAGIISVQYGSKALFVK